MNRLAVEHRFPQYPCLCVFEEESCLCGTESEERALRFIARGERGARYAPCVPLAPMSAEQRAWCIAEILSVEGYDKVAEDITDSELAETVLNAWTDYCRDKGML